nr:MAG TPA: hypothetical protein [Caudoviricetes sp.]
MKNSASQFHKLVQSPGNCRFDVPGGFCLFLCKILYMPA